MRPSFVALLLMSCSLVRSPLFGGEQDAPDELRDTPAEVRRDAPAFDTPRQDVPDPIDAPTADVPEPMDVPRRPDTPTRPDVPVVIDTPEPPEDTAGRCAALFGGVRFYEECPSSRPDACRFYANPPTMSTSCATVCSMVSGASCVGAENNTAGTFCGVLEILTCDDTRDDLICTCLVPE